MFLVGLTLRIISIKQGWNAGLPVKISLISCTEYRSKIETSTTASVQNATRMRMGSDNETAIREAPVPGRQYLRYCIAILMCGEKVSIAVTRWWTLRG
jgi:hypothetical protein